MSLQKEGYWTRLSGCFKGYFSGQSPERSKKPFQINGSRSTNAGCGLRFGRVRKLIRKEERGKCQ